MRFERSRLKTDLCIVAPLVSEGETRLKRNTFFTQAAGAFCVAAVLAVLTGCKSQVGGDVMATVDGRKIFRSDVDKYYDNQVASAQQQPIGFDDGEALFPTRFKQRHGTGSKAHCGIAANAMRESRHPVSPSSGTHLGPPVRLDAGRPI